MRISVDKGDAGYHFGAHLCEVYLDGQKLIYCVTADEERGEAVCLICDERNRLVIEGDEFKRETRRGAVEIRIMAEAPDWIAKELRAPRP